jgi:hypothetical protein
MLSTSEKRFAFSTPLSSGNSQISAGAKSGEYGEWSRAEMPFPAKNCDTRSEERAGALS